MLIQIWATLHWTTELTDDGITCSAFAKSATFHFFPEILLEVFVSRNLLFFAFVPKKVARQELPALAATSDICFVRPSDGRKALAKPEKTKRSKKGLAFGLGFAWAA